MCCLWFWWRTTSLSHTSNPRNTISCPWVSKHILCSRTPPSSNVPPSPLSSSDVHLIFNLVNASTSFRSAESWTPLCLPKFNDTGFLHAHVSYLPNDSPACLLLISTDKEKFFALQECQQKIFEVSHVCVQLLSAQSQPATFESEC